jgi:hypothetical protein
MDLKKLQRDIKLSYNKELETVEKRVDDLAKHISKEWNITPEELTLHEVKIIATTVVDLETQKLHDEVEALIAKKEQIERQLERKSEALQESKYHVFSAMEAQLSPDDKEAIAKLHQVKLQSIDLFDLLSEMVESAIISALEKEKDSDVVETIQEVIKELTYEAIKEGSLNTIRVRKILSTILHATIEVAEASPNQAKEILEPTLKGMRSGLVRAIDRFKKRLAFMPVEAKHILIEDYDTIIEDLNQSDSLFSQVVQTQADESSDSIKKIILDIKQSMHYDLEELLHISKEAAEVMRDRFSELAKDAVRRGEKALQSQAAQEAKRMGRQAIEIAKTALGNAIKTAKDAIDSKDK